jgi:hypothetical protein
MPYNAARNVEAMYLLGDFGVRIAGSTAVIRALPRELCFDDASRQDLGFYSGNVDYLFDILGKQAGSKSLAVNYVANGDKYIVCEVEMPSLHLTEKQAAELFTSNDITNIPYLICRQIVRDHGEATNRRGCAVRAELRGGQTVVVISLPRYDRPTKEINK